MSFYRRWWRSKRGECQECGEKLRPVIMSHAHGACGEVETTFSGLPTLGCQNPSHPKVFPYKDFGRQLLDAIFIAGELPAAIPQPNAALRCRGCGSSLEQPESYTGSVETDLSAEKLHSFHIKIAGPVIQCPTCGLEQLVAGRHAREQVAGAMTAAFKQVGLVAAFVSPR